MKIILFAKTLGSTRLCKISQEYGLLFNFGSLPKIKNTHFGHCGFLGAKDQFKPKYGKLLCIEVEIEKLASQIGLIFHKVHACLHPKLQI